MEKIPVYLFTGFMDSGKTTLIKETLLDNDFADGSDTLILVCEDGDEEYSKGEMARANAEILMVENQKDLTSSFIDQCLAKYHPDQLFVEYNGTWEVGPFLEDVIPDSCELVQVLSTVDATTFDNYITNMRPMMMEQLFPSDVVIFNRCDDDTPKGRFRRIVKAQNRKAQIAYERADGTMDEGEEPLPYDMTSNELDITDMDFGIWYLDVMDHPKDYEGKTVHFLALVYHPANSKPGIFIPGRFAMTCCVEDIQFLGVKCKCDADFPIKHKSWLDVTGTIKYEYAREYKGRGPVIYATSLKPAEKPEDELVYFN